MSNDHPHFVHPLADVQTRVIGDRVTIKNGVQLWDGLRVEDDVFIGPNAAVVAALCKTNLGA